MQEQTYRDLPDDVKAALQPVEEHVVFTKKVPLGKVFANGRMMSADQFTAMVRAEAQRKQANKRERQNKAKGRAQTRKG
ncbi:MAG: hypothetical protein V2A73_06795 [Pseudomonadota bacterium]